MLNLFVRSNSKRVGVVIIGIVTVTPSELYAQKDKAIKYHVKKYLGPQRRTGKYVYHQTSENLESSLFPEPRFKSFIIKYV
jgi:hypothetical protein